MKRNIIFFVLLALAMSSCEYVLDFSGGDMNPRLFVFGMPGSSDMTVVKLHSTVPMGDRTSGPLPLDDARVSLVVNGEEVVMVRADEAVPDLPEGSFYTMHPVLPGDKVEVKASAGGMEPVWAESLVPGEFPENEVDVEVDSWLYENHPARLRFSVRFKDDAETMDHYAMQVLLMKEYYSFSLDNGSEVLGHEYEYIKPVGDYEDDGGMELYPFRRPVILNYNSGLDLYSEQDAPMMIFDDRNFADGEGIMEFPAKYVEDEVSEATWMNGVLLDEKGYHCSYMVILYRLSPELYNFIRTNEIQSSNLLILLAAAPPSYVYTNIHGGVGVFGGISRTETDWIPNVDIAQNLQ